MNVTLPAASRVLAIVLGLAFIQTKAIPYKTLDLMHKTELRRQANIKPDMRLNLAEALHLGSRAAQFFLGIAGRQRCSIDPVDRRPAGGVSRSHSNLITLLKSVCSLSGNSALSLSG